MPGATLILHIVSLILIILVSYKIMSLSGQLVVLKALLKGQCGWHKENVVVDWPEKFLKRLAESLEIEFSLDKASGDFSGQPKKLTAKGFIQCYFNLPIVKIDLSLSSKGREAVFYVSQKKLTQRKDTDLENVLSRELGLDSLEFKVMER